MANLSISKAWDETRDVIARDGRLIISVALALILFPEAVAGVIAPPPALSGEQGPAWLPVLNLVVGLLGIAAQIAVMRLAIGPATSVGEAVGHAFRRLFPAIAALLIFALPVSIVLIVLIMAVAGPDAMTALMAGTIQPRLATAFLAFVIVAILISVRFQMVIPVTTAERQSPFQIVRRSFELTAGHYWRLLAVLALACVAAIVLLVAAQIIGGIVAKLLFGDVKPFSGGALLIALLSGAAQAMFAATLSVMLARIYVQLAGSPKSGT